MSRGRDRETGSYVGIDSLFQDTLHDRIGALDPNLDALSAATELRRSLDPETARLAAQQLELRRRAAGRFHVSGRILLTPAGLEQATHRLVARDRARRVAARHPSARVLDATAGLGGDSIALAEAGLRVVGADLDPVHARMLRWNLVQAGVAPWVVRADARAPAARADVYLADPGRREGDRRPRLEPGRWLPPLEDVLEVARGFRSACIKLPPHLPLERVGGIDRPHSWSWVSLGGDLRELTLWLGELAAEEPRQAVRLEADGGRTELSGDAAGGPAAGVADPDQGDWITEPDPAVSAAGLVDRLAERLGLARLDREESYLLGRRPDLEAPLRSWPVLDRCSLDPRRVRRMLAAHDVGELVVKKRSHPDSSATLERRFKSRGRRRGRILVARTRDGYRAHLIEISSR